MTVSVPTGWTHFLCRWCHHSFWPNRWRRLLLRKFQLICMSVDAEGNMNAELQVLCDSLGCLLSFSAVFFSPLFLWCPQLSCVARRVWLLVAENGPNLGPEVKFCCTNPAPCALQGELNGHKGLVPSNFLEEVPDDVEVYLTDSPSRYVPDAPARIKTKRVHAPSQY